MVIPANKWLIGAIPAALLSGATLWEGTQYYAYYDIAGVPTVCQGYTGKGIVFGKKYSPEECLKYLTTELKEHSNGVLNCIAKPLDEKHYIAFSLFAYNIGVSGFCGSRAARLFNTGLSEQACKAISNGPDGKPVWSYVNGNVYSRGLYNRRVYERSICLGVPYVKPT